MGTRLALAAPLALLVAAACDDTFISISTDGRIEVAVNTSGIDADPDGFRVRVDGGAEQVLAPGATVVLTDLSAGTHSVQLSGLAGNCRVEGTNPREVVVGSDGPVSVVFRVSCARITTGGMLVIVSTGDESPDADGYLLAVGGGEIRPIPLSARETFEGLAPGMHLVSLKDVDPPCMVTGANPQPITVVRAETVTVRFTVVCGARG